jgi:hypothetical protein
MNDLLDQLVVIVGVKFNAVLLTVIDNFFGADQLSNLEELILIVYSFEQGLPEKSHTAQHTAHTPDVQGIVIVTVPNKKFRGLEIS